MTDILYRTGLVRADGDGRTVHGLGVPFNVVAEVDDGLGPYQERFEYGAFARSIAERGHKVKLIANHDVRRFPVGRATSLEERPDGLHVAFAVAATRDGDDVLELVRSQTVDAFSVGFSPRRERRDGDVTVRTEVALREVSLTAFPAYEGAAIAGVRSAHPTALSVDVARRRLDLTLRNW